jgi:ribosome assembly protein YihI (activator of Der GTPase)
MTYKWIKFHTCHSYGYGPIQYEEIDAEEFKDLKSFLSEKDDDLNTQSEHWRGIKGEYIDKPPQEWIDKELKRIEELLRNTVLYHERLKNL